MDDTRMPRVLLATAGLLAAAAAVAQDGADAARDPKQTEVWTPVPAVVAAPAGRAPSDAIVLFDGKDVSAWEGEQGGRVPWKVADGAMTVVPGSKGIRTRQRFCDIQLHVEWRTPTETKGFDGQNRGNSGIFLQELYELQVLDSYNNPTYANGQAGSIYKQAMPRVNASRAPGEWQAYDIVWKAPRFSPGGGLTSPARITVLHNGVLVQDDTVVAGRTEYIGPPSYSPHGCAPLYLQEHDSKVSYRNIWVREL
ncbi:large, multifunctional secreted protein [Stenotrophomonas maltophilia]|uniref:Large, multifunctional secreted protein n=1 Tax=Stenotrophomonas maltophilia TaxID=40324 RepID=A0A1A6Y4T5_STEMA|nr:large, multifunctional secreted protein [Stenotrophomonas maltophilia]